MGIRRQNRLIQAIRAQKEAVPQLAKLVGASTSHRFMLARPLNVASMAARATEGRAMEEVAGITKKNTRGASHQLAAATSRLFAALGIVARVAVL